MGKSCSGKSCMVLARLARIKNAKRGNSKGAIVRAQNRHEISAPINQTRPHNIFAEAAASEPQGRRRQPGKGQRPRSHHVDQPPEGRDFAPPALVGGLTDLRSSPLKTFVAPAVAALLCCTVVCVTCECIHEIERSLNFN